MQQLTASSIKKDLVVLESTATYLDTFNDLSVRGSHSDSKYHYEVVLRRYGLEVWNKTFIGEKPWSFLESVPECSGANEAIDEAVHHDEFFTRLYFGQENMNLSTDERKDPQAFEYDREMMERWNALVMYRLTRFKGGEDTGSWLFNHLKIQLSYYLDNFTDLDISESFFDDSDLETRSLRYVLLYIFNKGCWANRNTLTWIAETIAPEYRDALQFVQSFFREVDDLLADSSLDEARTRAVMKKNQAKLRDNLAELFLSFSNELSPEQIDIVFEASYPYLEEIKAEESRLAESEFPANEIWEKSKSTFGINLTPSIHNSLFDLCWRECSQKTCYTINSISKGKTVLEIEFTNDDTCMLDIYSLGHYYLLRKWTTKHSSFEVNNEFTLLNKQFAELDTKVVRGSCEVLEVQGSVFLFIKREKELQQDNPATIYQSKEIFVDSEKKIQISQPLMESTEQSEFSNLNSLIDVEGTTLCIATHSEFVREKEQLETEDKLTILVLRLIRRKNQTYSDLLELCLDQSALLKIEGDVNTAFGNLTAIEVFISGNHGLIIFEACDQEGVRCLCLVKLAFKAADNKQEVTIRHSRLLTYPEKQLALVQKIKLSKISFAVLFLDSLGLSKLVVVSTEKIFHLNSRWQATLCKSLSQPQQASLFTSDKLLTFCTTKNRLKVLQLIQSKAVCEYQTKYFEFRLSH